MGRQKRWKPPVQKEDESGRKRLVLIFGLIMIFLMVFSVASVVVYNPGSDNQLRYGDVEFELENRANGGSVLVAELGGEIVEFQNLPVQVQYLEMDPQVTSILQSADQIALSADPDMALIDAGLVDYARLQLWTATGKTANAILREDDRYTLPVINCSHASAQMPVVVFTLSNATGIGRDGYCVFIEGQQQDVTRAKDRIIFEYHGILKDGEVVN